MLGGFPVLEPWIPGEGEKKKGTGTAKRIAKRPTTTKKKKEFSVTRIHKLDSRD